MNVWERNLWAFRYLLLHGRVPLRDMFCLMTLKPFLRVIPLGQDSKDLEIVLSKVKHIAQQCTNKRTILLLIWLDTGWKNINGNAGTVWIINLQKIRQIQILQAQTVAHV